MSDSQMYLIWTQCYDMHHTIDRKNTVVFVLISSPVAKCIMTITGNVSVNIFDIAFKKLNRAICMYVINSYIT